jgi:glycosyltransferase involved in cell wall biosynthesis
MAMMTDLRRSFGAAKGRVVRGAGAGVARARRPRGEVTYRPGVTVVTVNWNSLPFLRVMLDATRAMSPPETKILVVDNASSDGSVEYLRSRSDVRVMRLPINVGHGVALDLAMSMVDTEYVAVLDVDAFPISDRWLSTSLTAMEHGAQVAGARMHRNFVHPCFLVTRTSVVHRYGLTFRPVGSLSRSTSRAPLFFDVGEALSQRVILRFGGGRALHFFEITSLRGPDNAGAVFGDLVYHNQFATQGKHRTSALAMFLEEAQKYHPGLRFAE